MLVNLPLNTTVDPRLSDDTEQTVAVYVVIILSIGITKCLENNKELLNL